MGIPSYFSYLVRNYPHVLSQFFAKKRLIDNLYLDCNSIIYDAYHRQMATSQPVSAICPQQIIDETVSKIKDYISLINPQKTVYIAFDGIAPLAKIEQQRARRFKSQYQTNMKRKLYTPPSSPTDNDGSQEWSSLAITPGTDFMKHLDIAVKNAFKNNPHIIVSGSEEAGEGEHKIFEYIRNHPAKHKTESTVIYGLDADLIVLAILYTDVCGQIGLLRESPHFHLENLEPNQLYLLNIDAFARAIEINKYDYIVLTFLLGNDFLPHFPSVNIRTGGMDKLMMIYNMLFSKGRKAMSNLTTLHAYDGQRRICWPRMHKMFQFLAKKEHEYFQTEHDGRDRLARRLETECEEETADNMWKRFEALPMHDRITENYINPSLVSGWQMRYYAALFPEMPFTHMDAAQTHCNINQIVQNYCDGLEWVLNYYVHGCNNWRWTYEYYYPPLFADLYAILIPKICLGDPYISSNSVFYKVKHVSSEVQLCKVLPRSAFLTYFPDNKKAQEIMDKYGSKWFPEEGNTPFLWAYCRYFWESHPILPKIDIKAVEEALGN